MTSVDDSPWAPVTRHLAPHARNSSSRWILPPPGRTEYSTRVFHAALDCPAIRHTVESPRERETLREVDLDGPFSAHWRYEGDRGWSRFAIEETRTWYPEGWISCQRCGTAISIEVCGRCWLTVCDCSE